MISLLDVCPICVGGDFCLDVVDVLDRGRGIEVALGGRREGTLEAAMGVDAVLLADGVDQRFLQQVRPRPRRLCQASLELFQVDPGDAAALGADNEVQTGEHLLAHLCGEADRSEEHTSELQSLMRISYAVFCLKKK